MTQKSTALTAHDFLNPSRKLSMATCYDFTFAQILNQTPIDSLLVGDSLAMVIHGFSSTVHATLDMMVLHTAAVSRGAPQKFIIADLPFLSFRRGINLALDAVDRLIKAGAHAVKLEGVEGHEDVISAIIQSGIPVMGHLGLTPQSIHTMGGFKVQGKTTEASQKILNQALSLEKLGCFSIVLECVPASLGKKISDELKIATIGIGAGVHTDGQVLVLPDLLGLTQGFKPKFLRTYQTGYEQTVSALTRFHEDVLEQKFPNPEESYI